LSKAKKDKIERGRATYIIPKIVDPILMKLISLFLNSSTANKRNVRSKIMLNIS
jgi:hypothetical protein